MKCVFCGNDVCDWDKTCFICNKKQPTKKGSKMFCTVCKKGLLSSDGYCSNCGCYQQPSIFSKIGTKNGTKIGILFIAIAIQFLLLLFFFDSGNSLSSFIKYSIFATIFDHLMITFLFLSSLFRK